MPDLDKVERKLAPRWAAGFDDEDPGDLYFYDAVGNPDSLPDKRWMPLRDMLGQVDTFRRALATDRPWDALAREYPMIRNVAWALHEQNATSSLEEAQEALSSLLERYCGEWERFPARPPGWRLGTPDLTQDWRFRHAS